MSRVVNFFDGAESETTPVIGNVIAARLVQYPDDATYDATEQGPTVEGSIYFNTTLNLIRYYNGADWITLVDESTIQILTNKSIDADDNTITNIDNDEIRALAAIDTTKLADGSVDNTEFQYLNGVTSPIQDQLDDKQDLSEKGQPNGYAELDGSGLVPSSQLPSYVDDVLMYADLASFPVTGETGKIYVAEDTNFSYRWTGAVYVQIGGAGGANTALSNLTSPTAINESLIPSGTRSLGNSSTVWANAYITNVEAGRVQIGTILIPDGTLDNDLAIPSGLSASNVTLRANAISSADLALTTENRTGANDSRNIYIESGNQTGTANSGDIRVRPGTAAGGIRGKIYLTDGSEGTSGDVWTSTGVSGEGAWMPAAGSVSKYSATFNDTSDWGAPSGGYYNITVLESSHNAGLHPLIQVYKLNGSDYELVTPAITVDSATGDVIIGVLETPDSRFTGKIVIV